MGKRTPITELNIEELTNIAKESEEKLTKSKMDHAKRMHDYRIDGLNSESLNCIANNGYYEPYIFDFGYIVERLKNALPYDKDEESLRVIIDISEQISKMKNIPPFDTECHIESNNVKKCTSLWSFIRKKFFNQKKYRLVFHNNKIDYSKTYYERQKRFSLCQIIVFFEMFIALLSIVLPCVGLFVINLFAIIGTLIVVTLYKYSF